MGKQTARITKAESSIADQYLNLIEHAADGIAIIQDGVFRLVNSALVQISGYDKEELLGMPFLKLFTPEYQKLVMARYQDRLAGKDVPPIYEARAVIKSGEVRDIEINAALTEYEGRPADEVIVRDITERKKAEEALSMKTALLEAAAETTMDGILAVDEDDRVILSNRRFQEMHNIPQELIDAGDDKALRLHFVSQQIGFPEEDSLNTIEQLHQDKESKFQHVLQMKDGKVIETYTSPLLCAGGKYRGRIWYFHDITERKQVEEALRDSQEKLERMFESVTDGIVITDLDGKIIDANEKAVKLHGFSSKDEVIGENAVDLITTKYAIEGPEYREMIQEKGALEPHELVMLRTDGTEFLAEVSASLLSSAAGNPTGIVYVMRDVTERKRTEKALRDSEEKLRSMFESTSDGMAIVDLQGKFIEVNGKLLKIHGFSSKDEMIGKYTYEVVGAEQAVKWQNDSLRIIEQGSVEPYEVNSLRTDGTRVTCDVSGSVCRDTAGNPTSIVFIIRDITERKRAEERERQLQQELNQASRLASIGEMASGVAHEINNPLTSVIGFSQLLISRDIPDDIRDDLKVINSEAQRVAKIVEGLLAFARQRKPENEYVNIDEIIAQTLQMRSYQMEVNNIQLETQLAPDLPPIRGDANQLKQVFLNIVLNAEKEITGAHGRGKLIVKTERIDNAIRISFADNGPGISPENLTKVFNPFFTTREVGSGTGLGLSVCHGIVSAHNGKIYAESELGKGATFIVELPIEAVTGQAKKGKAVENISVAETESGKQGRAKVLVVDDEPAITHLFQRLLTEEGFEVVTANTAGAAIERLHGDRHALILMDIKMPVMSGIEIYRHIENLDPAMTKRVMFVTGDVMETNTRAFLDKTKARHITKPINIERFKAEIDHILSEQSSLQS